MSQIPRPYQAVQQQAERRSALRAAGFPHLGLLAAQQLFGVFESILDTPACIERFGNLLFWHVGICGEKEVVRLFALRIAHDQQLDRRAATHAVPKNDARVNEPLDYSSALIDGDSFQDALSALRKTIWRSRLFPKSGNTPAPTTIIQTLIEAAAYAA